MATGKNRILTGLGRYPHSGFPRQTMDGKAKVPRRKPAIWELGFFETAPEESARSEACS